tara:strand:- start:1493 stop:1891 length:399 start_codon:yes stop_codon:yes gene_type:complete
MNKDYNENVDTLVTFGDEGLTLRKDDPNTKEFISRKTQEIEDLENRSIFEGINLSNKRDNNESYIEYKDRIKLNNTLLKVYKHNGREKSWEMFPEGFASAVDVAKEAAPKPKMTATIDGKEIPVIINNDKDE